jgi:hypothetical protein
MVLLIAPQKDIHHFLFGKKTTGYIRLGALLE